MSAAAITLRPDQRRLIDDVFAAWRAQARGVLAVASTGFGKGECISHVLRLAAAHGRRTLFGVHLGEILFDVRSRLLASGLPSVRILSGTTDEGDPNAAVTLATWQTLAARSTTLDVQLVVADEAHRCKAATVLATLERHASARLLGLTATGQRGDGSGLRAVGFDSLVVGPSIADLVQAGHLAPIRVIAPDDYCEALAWDPVEAWLLHSDGEPGIIFASSIAHSREIAAGLQARGVRAVHVDSDCSPEQRAYAVAALETGEIDVICNFHLFTEGVNVRRCAVVMLAGAVSHDGPYLQRIGRARRPKARSTLIDLRGNRWRRGHPDAVRIHSLDGVGCSAAPEPLPPCRQCVCLAWVETAVCPWCGADASKGRRPLRVVRAELHEQTAAREAQRLARQAALPREGEEWELFSAIVRAQRAKGKAHTAPFLFKLKMGRPPRWKVDMVPDDVAEQHEQEAANG